MEGKNDVEMENHLENLEDQFQNEGGKDDEEEMDDSDDETEDIVCFKYNNIIFID